MNDYLPEQDGEYLLICREEGGGRWAEHIHEHGGHAFPATAMELKILYQDLSVVIK